MSNLHIWLFMPISLTSRKFRHRWARVELRDCHGRQLAIRVCSVWGRCRLILSWTVDAWGKQGLRGLAIAPIFLRHHWVLVESLHLLLLPDWCQLAQFLQLLLIFLQVWHCSWRNCFAFIFVERHAASLELLCLDPRCFLCLCCIRILPIKVVFELWQSLLRSIDAFWFRNYCHLLVVLLSLKKRELGLLGKLKWTYFRSAM